MKMLNSDAKSMLKNLTETLFLTDHILSNLYLLHCLKNTIDLLNNEQFAGLWHFLFIIPFQIQYSGAWNFFIIL